MLYCYDIPVIYLQATRPSIRRQCSVNPRLIPVSAASKRLRDAELRTR